MVSCSAALMVKGMTALIFPGGYPANSLPRVVINGRVMGSYYARSLKVTEANRQTRPCAAVRARTAVARWWLDAPFDRGDGPFLRPFGVFVAASASFCIRDARECDTATGVHIAETR